MSLIDFTSEESFNSSTATGSHVVHIGAKWCEPCKDLDKILEQLAPKYSQLKFARVDAEDVPSIAEKYDVNTVPYFVFLKAGKVVGKVEGALPQEIIKGIQTLAEAAAATTTNSAEALEQRLKALTNRSPIMLFMKGSPEAPKCGFSNLMVQLLQRNNIQFDSFDILTDQAVRDGLKAFSSWPTYPQLYSNGKLIGGLDIAKELEAEGELLNELGIEPLEKKLEKLVNKAATMLFMKGSPDTPKCGFSNQMVQLLKRNNITFDHFDILTDQTVREGLKKYSNWPTYPQLYRKGKLIGGLDIAKELEAEGELKDVLNS